MDLKSYLEVSNTLKQLLQSVLLWLVVADDRICVDTRYGTDSSIENLILLLRHPKIESRRSNLNQNPSEISHVLRRDEMKLKMKKKKNEEEKKTGGDEKKNRMKDDVYVSEYI